MALKERAGDDRASMLLMKGASPPMCYAMPGAPYGSPPGLWAQSPLAMVPMIPGGAATPGGPPMLYMLSHVSPVMGGPFGGGQSPPAPAFPDSPGMPDAAQMLLSPSGGSSPSSDAHAAKRRHLSPLVSGLYYVPAADLGRASPPVLRPAAGRAAKVLLSPRSGYYASPPMASGELSAGGSPGLAPQYMVMSGHSAWARSPPAFAAAPRASYAHGSTPAGVRDVMQLPVTVSDANAVSLSPPSSLGPRNGHWHQRCVANSRAYLHDTRAIDEENITIIEVKTLLRRYGLNATGKKHVLLERIRAIRAALDVFVAKEAAAPPCAEEEEAAALCRMAISEETRIAPAPPASEAGSSAETLSPPTDIGRESAPAAPHPMGVA